MESAIALDAAWEHDTTSTLVLAQDSVNETSARFKSEEVRLGITHCICGVFTLALGGVLMWLTANSIWASLVLPCGTVFGAAGLVTIVNGLKEPKNLLSASFLFNGASMMAASLDVGFFIYGIYVIQVGANVPSLYPGYRFKNNYTALQAVQSLLLVVGVIEMAVCSVCLFRVVRSVCSLWHRRRERVFTIPFDEAEAEAADGETRGPDIVADLRQRPMLQIEWEDFEPELI